MMIFESVWSRVLTKKHIPRAFSIELFDFDSTNEEKFNVEAQVCQRLRKLELSMIFR